MNISAFPKIAEKIKRNLPIKLTHSIGSSKASTSFQASKLIAKSMKRSKDSETSSPRPKSNYCDSALSVRKR